MHQQYGNKKTVILSFDAEFSINGTFEDPEHNQPCADSIFAPNPDGTEGLQDILAILTKHQVKSTFFTEVLNSYYFGHNKMHRYVKQMLACSQDIQLHTHPCWLVFKDTNWQKEISSKLVCDDFDSWSKNDIVEAIKECLTIFEQWNLPKPVAYRAGNLHPKLALYDALHELDFLISSSIDLPIFTPREPQLHINNEIAFFHQIAEFPVTSYKSMGIRDKALTITGTSFAEIKSVLNQSIMNSSSPVIILSHVHEFIKKNPSTGQITKNNINLKRLDSLCQFVKQSDDFDFSSFGEIAKTNALIPPKQKTSQSQSIIRTSILSGVWTLVQNKLNDSLRCF